MTSYIRTKKKPKRLLINVPHLGRPGGVAEIYRILDLEKAGLGRYFEIHDSAQEESSKWRVIVRMLKKYYQFFRAIASEEVIMINPSLMPKSFWRDAVFAWLTKFRKKKLLVFWHGWLEDYEAELKRSALLQIAFRNTYARADGFIVLGKRFKEKLLELGVKPSVPFLHFFNFADDQYIGEFDPRSRLRPKDRFRILFLSRIESGKGVYLAIDVVDRLRAAHADKELELVIAGDGPELPRVEQYIASRAMAGISCVGYVAGDQKAQLLREVDLFLFPSLLSEGMPLVVLEAMLYGLPVVASSTGGLKELIRNGQNGFLVETLDPDAFASVLAELIRDHDLYGNISRIAHQQAMQQLTPEPAKRQILNFVQTL